MIRALALSLALAVTAVAAKADMLVAAGTIRAKTVLGPSDLAYAPGDVLGALTDPEDAIGMEARVTLYAGRPIRPGDIGPPALVERNQIVPLIYDTGILKIATEARTMDRAAAGESIRVMNLSSRTTVTGTVSKDGTIIVSGAMP